MSFGASASLSIKVENVAFLDLLGLRKTYGAFNAVCDLDLAIDRGEFITMLGPSGCGKTTTLQMIAGFVDPSAGRIVLDGADLTRVPANARDLGIVFQSYALFPHMTVAENIAFGLEMRKIDKPQIRARVAQVLDLVGLTARMDQYPKQLSGGQQQRVALARALVIQPKILLLDEPLSNLDAKLREELQVELRRIQRKLGTTSILVTHDQQEALAISDRIVVINGGKVEQIGRPSQVYDNPATPFVAEFLGKVNSLRADARDGQVTIGGQVVARVAGTNGKVCVNLRSEKIRIVEAGAGTLSGRVTVRVFQGSHWLLHVATAGGVAAVIKQNDDCAPPNEGDSVGLSWATSDAIIRSAEGAGI